jgi:alcohol dehydrogenase (cytochrome c)
MIALPLAAAIALHLAATPAPAATTPADADWPGYNRTLTSERFSKLKAIDRGNVAKLAVRCTYDTGLVTSMQTGPIVLAGTLYATTETDTFSIDAQTCKENWRVHEDIVGSMLKVNRGVAWLDGKLYRGTQDGRVFAYDAATGKKLWEQRIADPAKGESVPAAPIAWNGLVFAGNAGGDNYDVKGRMYALDAATGKIVWEFYLVPREHPRVADADEKENDAKVDEAKSADPRHATWGNAADVPIAGGSTWTSYSLDPKSGLLYVPGGNPAPDFTAGLRPGDNLYTNSIVVLDAKSGKYRRHFQLTPEDFHDWDVASAPVITTTRSGASRLLEAPKDGHVYGYDLVSGERTFRTAVTTIANEKAPLTAKGTRFCPGTQGGNEWNGVAYDPTTNFAITGSVDWCSTVKVADDATVKNAALGQPWSGSADKEHQFGQMDPQDKWAGWLIATDADTGKIAWKVKTPAPILAAVTPTAGGLVFAADMTGNLYAVDAKTGKELWKTTLTGAIGGGIVTYEAGGTQFVAVAAGMSSPIWPAPETTAKIVVYAVK